MSLKPVLMVVLVEAAGVADKIQELVFLAKETLVEMVETGAAEAAEAVLGLLEETQRDLMGVLEA